jgi:TonB family protein
MQSVEHASQFQRAVVCVTLLLLFATPVRADRRQLEDALKPAFQNKIVFLRGFYSDANLRFDSQGNLIGTATAGVWTVNSTLLITGLNVDRYNLLTLKGKRVINVFDDDKGRFVNLTSNSRVQIAVELDPGWQDAAPVLTLLEKVIPSAFVQPADTVPDYWRCWLYGHTTRSKEGGPWKSVKWQCSLDQVAQPEAAKVAADVSKPFKVGHGVTPPKVLYRVEPTFTQAARDVHIEGITLLSVIVDKQGEPQVTGIVRPLGAGLDDQAIESVRKWRFAPATRNGEPVPVEVLLEVNYHHE